MMKSLFAAQATTRIFTRPRHRGEIRHLHTRYPLHLLGKPISHYSLVRRRKTQSRASRGSSRRSTTYSSAGRA